MRPTYTVGKPGDRLPIGGIEWTIVTAGGKTLKTNITGAPGAGRSNPASAYEPTRNTISSPE